MDDQLVNAFAEPAASTLRIVNGGALEARGMGLTVAGASATRLRLGQLHYGHGWRAGRPVVVTGRRPARLLRHEAPTSTTWSARVETFIDWSDTRRRRLYRLNTLTPESRARRRRGRRHARFDIQPRRACPSWHPSRGRTGSAARGPQPLLRRPEGATLGRARGAEPAEAGHGRHRGQVLIPTA